MLSSCVDVVTLVDFIVRSALDSSSRDSVESCLKVENMSYKRLLVFYNISWYLILRTPVQSVHVIIQLRST